MKRTTILAMVAVCLMAGGALAIGSDNYRLDWFTPLTGSGGVANSASYAIAFTTGQTASGASSSANYGGCLGFWCEDELTVAPAPGDYGVYLPVVLHNHS
jgi:hypothetical protein